MLTFGPSLPQTDFDLNIWQGHDPTCAIRSQELILRDFGIQIPQDELKQYATEQGWYSDGTPESCVGNLLETCKISTHSMHCESIYDIINELKDGHRVIVAVDSKELRNEPGTDAYEFYHGIKDPDHALIVTSININPLDPDESTVVLTDPGNGSILEYDMEQFAHAWRDSDCFMVATDEAAPYQYNADTGCMEVSNFATDFTLSNFPFHNEFSNIWEVNELGYVPFYGEGHLDTIISGMDYDDFVSAYDSGSIPDLDYAFGTVDEGSSFDDSQSLNPLDDSLGLSVGTDSIDSEMDLNQ